MDIAIGVDLGGTKIEIIAIDAQGAELLRRRQPTPRGSYKRTIEAIAGMVRQAENDLDQRCSVGIGHPGVISPVTGLLKNANTTWLNGLAIDKDLMDLPDRPIALTNDANCLGLSEATDGAGAGAAVVFSVILGTGVGGAVVVHGRVITGANAIAGEWGHNPLPLPNAQELPGPDCFCGLSGCIETWLSGPGLERDHARVTGQRLAAPAILEAAGAGDDECEQSLQRYEHRLARALATVINLLDPDVIVLGGGVSNLTRLYRNVPALWSRYVFSDTVTTALKKSIHGDSSGVRGAAWLGRAMNARAWEPPTCRSAPAALRRFPVRL